MKSPFQRNAPAAASFLPEDYVAQKVELRAGVLCLSLFGLVMFGVVAAFFVTNRQWLNVRAEQESITVQYTDQAQKIEQLKTLEAQKAEMIAKAEVTTALIEKVPRSVLVSELVRQMPENVTLLEVKLESKRVKEDPVPGLTAPKGQAPPKVRAIQTGPGAVQPPPGAKPTLPDAGRVRAPRFETKLVITGVAKENTEVTDYYKGLLECKLLDKVELRHIKERKIDKVVLREFIIEAIIRPDADARSLEIPTAPSLGAALGDTKDPQGTASATPGKE